MALWLSNMDTPPLTKKQLSQDSGYYSSPLVAAGNKRRSPLINPNHQLTYLSPGLVVSLCRRDLVLALVQAGCPHLATKIFSYLDSASLLACSLVCVSWQRLLLTSIYTTQKFRRRVRHAIFHGRPRVSRLILTLDQPPTQPASVVDVALDDDFNIFALAILGGRTHVMSCSLFGLGKKRWVHRFAESLEPNQLSCISAGQSLVALGLKDGRVHLYEVSHRFRCLRLSAILSHHTGAIHGVIFSSSNNNSGGGNGNNNINGYSSYIVTCSDDMSLGVVSILPNGSLLLSKLLHGHVSRVRAIDVQNGKIISGSDDRTVKLWSLRASSQVASSSSSSSSNSIEKPLNTLTGHSGPVTCVQLALPYALSAAGSTVRLWNVVQGTCLKLLQHSSAHQVTTMSWISTFKGVSTVDSAGQLRCFDLCEMESANQEIVVASSITRLHDLGGGSSSSEDNSSDDGSSNSSSNSNTSPTSSPTATSASSRTSPLLANSPKLYRGSHESSPSSTNSSNSSSNSDSSISCWPSGSVFKLESIPHHFSAFSLSNSPSPSITVHCLDYIL